MQKSEQNDRSQQNADDNAADRIIDRGLDESAGVAHPDQPHAARNLSGSLQFIDRVADRVDHLDRVGVAFLDDLQNDARFAVVKSQRPFLLRLFGDHRDVAQIDAPSPVVADFQRGKVVEALEFRIVGDVHLLNAAFDPAGRHFEVGRLDLLDNFRNGQTECRQLFLADLDLDLQRIAAGNLHFGDAENRRQPVGQLFVGIIVHFIDRQLADQHQGDHRRGGRIELLNFRILGGGRQIILHQVDFFAHIHRGNVDVDAELEFQSQNADILHAGGIHILQTVDRADRILQPFGDFNFNLFRAGARIDDRHSDIRHIDIRIKIQSQFAVGTQPEQQHDQDHTGHRNRPGHGSLAQKHTFTPPAQSGRSPKPCRRCSGKPVPRK